MPIPPTYKETGHWVQVKHPHAKLGVGIPWWTLYHDLTLTQLEQKVTCNNENLKLALANYEEARTLAAIARSAMYPSIIAPINATRQQSSNTIVSNAIVPQRLYNTFTLAAVLNYEVDAWGRVRNSVLSSDRLARASRFDMASIQLSLHAELASAYFELRGAEVSLRLLDSNILAYKKIWDLTNKRYRGGAVAESSLLEAQAALEDAKTRASAMRLNCATLEHAIAVLIGEIPSNFHIPPSTADLNFVTVSPNLPSILLTRRPDVRAAADRVEAANATIGIANAAFLPAFNLSGMLGQQSSFLSELLTKPSRIWALGPSTGVLTFTQPEITQILFDGFKLQAQLAQTRAAYLETVSIYKQTVLTAFQQVEDALVSIHRLNEEHQTQTKATKATNRLLYQAHLLHQGGAQPLMTVLLAKNTAIESELNLVAIHMQRQLASVQLIKALGGGWSCCEKKTNRT